MTGAGRLRPISWSDAVQWIMPGRRTNLALGFLVVAAVLTGLASNTIGVERALDLAMIHGVTSLGILVLAPWKSIIIRRGLAKPRPGNWTSLVLLGLLVAALGTGLLHSTGTTYRLGALTVMQIHVGAGMIALALVVQHYLRHPVRPRGVDLDRRAFLRITALAGLATLSWWGWEWAAQALRWPGSKRRFTGSHERGSGDPSLLPVTSWFDDQVPLLDPDRWEIAVGNETYRLHQLTAITHEKFEALLDCTGGWYSVQEWEGVRLDQLLAAEDWRSFEVRSATGYARRFPIGDLRKVYLVTKVGNAPISLGHGYPARVVAPGRRGFWWVKWVVRIKPSRQPWWVQSPFPLT